MRAWKSVQVDRVKPLVFVLGLYPLLRWVWLGFSGGLTANPAEFLTRSSGLWAWVLLLITLGITPLRRVLGQPALLRLRRMLGLFAFFYTALHTVAWAWWDRSGDWLSMWHDIVQRPFITLGAVATVLMLLLAATSTHGWQRRLGRRWSTLHRSVYAVAALSVVHFYLVRAGKNDVLDVLVYAAIFLVLMLLRKWPAAARQSPAA
ncbi:sulfite oxidase heme-binding subunit YedZ [Alcaligenes sp. SDU_A2]|uniref:sulfite oxidase heme-binding subunit YedZ n=1 Tax=Alcaligenes sp. SDU_A2 TaxID=3136634 RepID=UPI00311DCE5F